MNDKKAKTKFRKGQTVYIQGRYRAKVVDCGPHTVTCDVYEGLALGQKPPQRAQYHIDLVEPKKQKIKL
jgi:hypothetical protein